MKLSILDIVALVLVIVGGLNWGLAPLGYNLVDMIFGPIGLAVVVYYLVGLAAIWVAVISMKLEKK